MRKTMPDELSAETEQSDSDGDAVHSSRVRGVCPVLETPFDVRGEADGAALENLIDHLARIGTPAVMFAGFASESLKLADAERDALTEAVITRGRLHGVVVVASVSDHSTLVAAKRAAQYAEWGANLINVLPPYQLSPSPKAVRAHLGGVLDAVSQTPVIVQYAPAQTGTALDAAAIAELANDAPNFVQVKVESAPPGRLIGALRDSAPRLESLVGYAGLQLPDALRRGAVGVQPGASFTELYLELWRLWVAADEDGLRRTHTRLLPYLSYWMQNVELIVAAEKRISYLRGLIPTATCRAPGWELDHEELSMIDKFMDDFADDFTSFDQASGTRP